MSIQHAPRRLCLALFFLLLPSFAPGADLATAPPRTIIVVRHAERIRPDGDVELSDKGRERAKMLAWTLKDQSLRAIYISQMIRTRETAAPVAAAAGIVSEVVPADKPNVLVEKLGQLRPGECALVVHHSGSIPKIVDGLGAGKISPIPEDEFDRMIIISLPAGGKPAITTLRYGPHAGQIAQPAAVR
jgi:phosphohistidine phosphatase SixA